MSLRSCRRALIKRYPNNYLKDLDDFDEQLLDAMGYKEEEKDEDK